MNDKKKFFIVLLLILSMGLTSCGNDDTNNNITNETANNSTNTQIDNNLDSQTKDTTNGENTENIQTEEKDIELKILDNENEKITFNGDSISYSGDNVFIDGNKLTIKKSGNYEISGELNEGQIIVDTDDDDAVQIILSGVNITNTSTSPIYVSNAKQTIITLASNTTNILTDGEKYTFNEDEPNATIFSKDELIIMGNGDLIVNANYNDGISSKDELVIYSGNITVNSVDDGIRGKNYLQIEGGNINITSAGDSLKADNEEKGQIIINDGNIEISSGDDGIHAEIALEINGGSINITKSYEGLESKVITINDGTINIISSDDGINVAGGNDSSGMMGPGGGSDFGGGMGGTNISYYIYINGGIVNVNATGDGLDANGAIVMTGGKVYVNGPTSSGNGPLDYDIGFEISGGILVAAGSSGMAQNIGSNSSQYGVLFGFDSSQAAGTKFELKDSSGNTIIFFSPEKTFQSIVISVPELENGETYTYYLDGEEGETFTISSIITSVGSIGRGMGGGGGARMGGGGRGGQMGSGMIPPDFGKMPSGE